jgi:putative hydrolase of the HAD superfamily
MKPELILFDLDDTLIAFGAVAEEAWEKSVQQFIVEEKIDAEKESLLEKLHKTRKWYWSDPERHRIGRKDIVKARREVVKIALQDCINIAKDKLEKLADNYTNIQENLWRLFDGTEETLTYIKEKNVKIGLVTNGTSVGQRRKLKRFDLEKYFDFIFIEEEVGYRKPDIRMYEYILKEINIPKTKICMIGDNLVWDVEAPQKTGIFSIWHNYGKKDAEGMDIKPDMIINAISELMEDDKIERLLESK